MGSEAVFINNNISIKTLRKVMNTCRLKANDDGDSLARRHVMRTLNHKINYLKGLLRLAVIFNGGAQEMDSLNKKVDIAFNAGRTLRISILGHDADKSESEDDNRLRGFVYRLVNLVSVGDRDQFINTVVRIYSGHGLPMPAIFKCLYGRYFDDNTLKSIEIACKYHDYGKAAYVFQKMIGNQEFLNSVDNIKEIQQVYEKAGFEKTIPHGYLSPYFIPFDDLRKDIGEANARYVCNAVFYHHNREQTANENQFKQIIKGDLQPRFGIKYKPYTQYLFNGASISDDRWISYAIILGMLNKFDYYASDMREKYPVEISGEFEGKYLLDCVADWFSENKFDYRPVQKYMLENRDENLIIVASTGIGKTEAALLWAGEQKLFYTLPLKVSINAMYDRVKSEYGYDEKRVTLLHSDAAAHLSA